MIFNKNRDWPVIFSLLLASLFCCCNNSEYKRLELKRKSLADNVGDIFRLNDVIDSSGNQVELDFSKSDLTIIDFWFSDCPPCIDEMKQFSEVLAGKEGKISVISISINQFWLWKSILTNHTGRFSFLNNTTSNWVQLALRTSQDAKLKNEISVDRIREIQKLYNITFFPAYFIVNKRGIILERPVSAVEFIRKYK